MIRQISISGNDKIESDKIRDALTLTTGSTLDYPLLRENTARIEALYRAEGYYLAEVSYEIEPLREGSISINFDVKENEKLHLEEIIFEGNEAFTAKELTEGFETKTWIPVWSTLTSWFTKAGTYSEPIFIRDIQSVEKLYTDHGYLQVEVGEPDVEPREDGLYVTGPASTRAPSSRSATRRHRRPHDRPRRPAQEAAPRGGEDLQPLVPHRGRRGARALLHGSGLLLRAGHPGDAPRPRSAHRGRGLPGQEGAPLLHPPHRDRRQHPHGRPGGPARDADGRGAALLGPRDPALQYAGAPPGLLRGRLLRPQAHRRSGPARPRGRRGRASDRRLQLRRRLLVPGQVRAQRVPQQHQRLRTRLRGQPDRGVRRADLALLPLADRSLLPRLRPSAWASRASSPRCASRTSSRTSRASTSPSATRCARTTPPAASSTTASRSDASSSSPTSTRRRRCSARSCRRTRAPAWWVSRSGATHGTTASRRPPGRATARPSSTRGSAASPTTCAARAASRTTWRRPTWMFERSAFVWSSKIGYALPFNTIGDYNLDLPEVTPCDNESRCVNVANLDDIDTDVKLPLSDRYFLGGIGSFQLRGYKARSVGPRRPILRRNQLLGRRAALLPRGNRAHDRRAGAPRGGLQRRARIPTPRLQPEPGQPERQVQQPRRQEDRTTSTTSRKPT